MTLEDAREFVKIIRKENYKANPMSEQFIKSIETGKVHIKNNNLSDKQVQWLKSIYYKATVNK